MNSFLLITSEIVKEETIHVVSPELIISILALIISISAVIVEVFKDRKINRTNLEAVLSKDIYEDFLINKIPNARRMIHYSNEVVTGTDDLIEVLNDIRRASLFYKYNDEKYYKLLCEELQALEDKLVKKTGRMEDDKYARFVTEINEDVAKIYNTITNKYIGKKVKKR